MRATQTHLRQTQTRAHPGGEQKGKTDYNRAAEILFYLRRPVGSAVKNHRIKHLAPVNSKRINPAAVKCEDWRCCYLERANVVCQHLQWKSTFGEINCRWKEDGIHKESVIYFFLWHFVPPRAKKFCGFILRSHSQCRRWHQKKNGLISQQREFVNERKMKWKRKWSHLLSAGQVVQSTGLIAIPFLIAEAKVVTQPIKRAIIRLQKNTFYNLVPLTLTHWAFKVKITSKENTTRSAVHAKTLPSPLSLSEINYRAARPWTQTNSLRLAVPFV